jgi:hypothetical protein
MALDDAKSAKSVRVEAGLTKLRRFWRGISTTGAAILVTGVVLGILSGGKWRASILSVALVVGGLCVWIGEREHRRATTRRENFRRSGFLDLPSGGVSGKIYHFLPHEKWAASHADRFLPRWTPHTSEQLQQASGTVAFDLFVAFKVNLRLFIATALTIVAIAGVLIVVININGGPISTNQHPDVIASVVSEIVFWPLVLVSASSAVALYVRRAQWQRERRLFAG